MKTKLTVLLGALALSGYIQAGPSDGAAFAIRHAQESASRQSAVTNAVVTDSGSFKYGPASNTKGGTVLVPSRETAVTNIALFKSPKAKACKGSACCAKK